ncbi:hypothetical protein predicted by Glimmer/Critica [Sorangium cellulosum So ce56]|uniref:Uncharacterized protein n=2 Tax=Sorangium cellulosum TaxID=56 RepID=A9GAP9_SORC5|nr:hypothetical protein predicted by Glimmer/Critica [Sorangium cellulosum So ce56]
MALPARGRLRDGHGRTSSPARALRLRPGSAAVTVVAVRWRASEALPSRDAANNQEKRPMKLRSISVLVCAFALGAASCSKEAPSAGKTAPEPAQAKAAHAPADVKPGSHEDWCGEHQVPESQCTRCNADLIPAFKATGDWCAEHGLPESQCLKCNPDLKIVRPPKGS